jgi:hypothetical protein
MGRYSKTHGSGSAWRSLSFLLAAFAISAALTACGGGGSGSKGSNKVTLTLISGSGQTAQVGGQFTSQFVAQLTKDGTPLPGVTVSFQAPGSGASGTFQSNNSPAEGQTTDANGNATSSVFSANTVAGAYMVSAVVEGATQPVNFSLTNTAGAAANITASSGSGQSAIVLNVFSVLVATVTDTYGNPVSNQQVTFTAPAQGASGTFSGGSNTEQDTTDANGNATSSTFMANATPGAYTVQATGGSLTPASFTLTNLTTVGLATGNYVFSLDGEDTNSYYSVAGAFEVGSTGAIVRGEEDFVDSTGFYGPVTITGGVITPNATGDGNTEIVLNTNNSHVGVSGVQTLDASMISGFKGLIINYDASATSSGRLDQQTSTSALCPSAPTTPCGYAFSIGGVYGTSKNPVVVGGVATIDQAGGVIDGTGSEADTNLNGTLQSNQMVTGTVGAPDNLGRFTLNLTISTVTSVVLKGYIVDANHLRLVEDSAADTLVGATGGAAYGQTGTGAFSNSSIAGANYVFSMSGKDNANGALQVAGVLTFPSSGNTVTGAISYNDLTVHNAQGGTSITGGTFIVDANGGVTLIGVTDGTATYNLQMYLDGNGRGTIVSMDTTDELRGQIYQQVDTTLNANSLNGTYFLDLVAYTPSPKQREDGVGSITASAGSTLNGFADENQTFTAAAALAPNQTLSDTYANPSGTPANGVLLLTGTGTGGAQLTIYLVDTTQGVIIENDTSGLELEYFTNQ